MHKACIEVVVRPRGGRDRLVGMVGDALRVAVSAPPVDGKANDAVIALLAKQLGVPRSSVSIASGKTGRRKLVCFEGLSSAQLKKAVQSVLGPLPGL